MDKLHNSARPRKHGAAGFSLDVEWPDPDTIAKRLREDEGWALLADPVPPDRLLRAAGAQGGATVILNRHGRACGYAGTPAELERTRQALRERINQENARAALPCTFTRQVTGKPAPPKRRR